MSYKSYSRKNQPKNFGHYIGCGENAFRSCGGGMVLKRF